MKAQLGRADLLRAWVGLHGPAAAFPDEVALAQAGAVLGFRHQTLREVPSLGLRMQFADEALGALAAGEMEAAEVVPPAGEQPLPPVPPPLQTRFLALLQTLDVTPDARRDAGVPSQPLQSLSPLECAPRPGAQEPAFSPLLPQTRLWPVLKRSLAQPQARGVDLARLVDRVARGQMLARLPRQRRQGAVGQVWVVLDVAQRLIPCTEDYHQILAEVRRLFGPEQVWIWVADGDPRAVGWVQRGRAEVARVRGAMPVPPVGTPVLILGDLGRLAREPGPARAWDAACQRWAAAGALPVAWLPTSPARVAPGMNPHVRAYCLGGGPLQPLQPVAAHRAGVPQPAAQTDEALHTLLTSMACALRVSPRLLRALRQLSPATAQEPALEVLAWDARQVAAGYRCCELRPAELPAYRARFAALAPEVQDAVLEQMLAHHASGGRSTETLEALIWQAHAQRLPSRPATQEKLQEADLWLRRLTTTPNPPGDLAAYGRDLLARQQADAHFMQAQSSALATLWALTGQPVPPPGLKAQDVAQALALPTPPQARSYLLIQRGQQVFLEPETPQRFPWPRVDIEGEWFEWGLEGVPLQSMQVPIEGRRVGLPLCQKTSCFLLRTNKKIFYFWWFNRPSWATEIGFNDEGLYVCAPSVFYMPIKFKWAQYSGEFDFRRFCYRGFVSHPVVVNVGRGEFSRLVFDDLNKINGRHKSFSVRKQRPFSGDGKFVFGVDIEFGPYIDIFIMEAVQRFRWIEPGEFWVEDGSGAFVGKPDGGVSRAVRLSQGCWLGDTACSQAFWMAVMGGDSIELSQSLDGPVEGVSWFDVQRFLNKLTELLPRGWAELPTEAEWEYACKAGHSADFSPIGSCDGFSSQSQGRVQGLMLAQNSDLNPWGLYYTNINLWEFCKDSKGFRQLEPVLKREGLLGSNSNFSVRYCVRRKGARKYVSPDESDRLVGFRFVLRGV